MLESRQRSARDDLHRVCSEVIKMSSRMVELSPTALLMKFSYLWSPKLVSNFTMYRTFIIGLEISRADIMISTGLVMCGQMPATRWCYVAEGGAEVENQNL